MIIINLDMVNVAWKASCNIWQEASKVDFSQLLGVKEFWDHISTLRVDKCRELIYLQPKYGLSNRVL